MFIGHFGVAFGAKRAAPRVSLGTMLLAAQFADLLWPILLLLGLESVRIDPGNTAAAPLDFVSYPISHSLLLALAWGAVLGAAHWYKRRDPRSALVVAAVVVSHWVLDWISHRPDMPLYPGGPKFGLGLWNSIPATVAVEALILVTGVALYLGATRARDLVGHWAFWALVGFLILGYVANLAGPPPQSARFLAWFGLGLWLIVPWGYWIDRHRMARSAGSRRSRDGLATELCQDDLG